MTAVISLGSFDRVPLKEAWPTEDDNFTPWLAQPENIALLSEALNMELEVEAIEHWVGSFRADILARAVDDENENEHRVIIENQFGRTNHGHLGQILTYLAGIDNAKTIVWIAETIQPDHRAALDWLNTNTVEDFSFFAIEIELWRIGNSSPAPRFNVIASPNDWTKSARKASVQVGEPVTSELRHVHLAYWSTFAEYLKKKASTFRLRRPREGNVVWFPTGRSGTVICAIINTKRQHIGVALYTDKPAFHLLHRQKEAIDTEIGEPLDWQELPEQKRSRINLYKDHETPSDQSQREEQHAWLLSKMERFRAALIPRLKALAPSSAAGTSGEEEPLDDEE